MNWIQLVPISCKWRRMQTWLDNDSSSSFCGIEPGYGAWNTLKLMLDFWGQQIPRITQACQFKTRLGICCLFYLQIRKCRNSCLGPATSKNSTCHMSSSTFRSTSPDISKQAIPQDICTCWAIDRSCLVLASPLKSKRRQIRWIRGDGLWWIVMDCDGCWW
jgi:hypothetical protein